MAKQMPGIPSIDPNVQTGVNVVLAPLKESQEIANGLYDWQRTHVTLDMLVRLGVITETQGKTIKP